MELTKLPGKKILNFMHLQGYRIRAMNIVYLVGASPEDWSPNDNEMDVWNDVRLIIRDSGEVLGSWTATTDPGRYYEENPTDEARKRGGCSILAFGQHKDAWELGCMHDCNDWPALMQCANVTIYVDRAEDGKRYGHTQSVGPEAGICHHGCDGTNGGNSVGHWSAGCQVGRYWQSHLKFIEFCRNSGDKTFDATLLDSKAALS